MPISWTDPQASWQDCEEIGEWSHYSEWRIEPIAADWDAMTPEEQREYEERRQWFLDFCFSDAPEEMKKELGVRPIRWLNQDGKPLEKANVKSLVQLREEAAIDLICGNK
jgi:hypothetical protein